MPTNKEIMKNWQLPENTGYGRIYEALNEAIVDEQNRLKKLVVLREKLKALDDNHWDTNNWKKYSKEWNRIKTAAKAEIKRLEKAKTLNVSSK